jgi:hypothetical protein
VEDPDDVAESAHLQAFYDSGYRLERPVEPEKLLMVELVAWAQGVWQRQSELMPERKDDPDLKAKLQAQLKGKPEPPKKKRSGWD